MESKRFKSLKSRFKRKSTEKEDSDSANKDDPKPMLTPDDIQRIFKIIKKYSQ